MRLLLVAVAAVLSGCRHLPSGAVPTDRSLTAYVSSDAVMLAGVRLEALRATPTYQRLSENAKNLSQLDEFSRKTGLDPRKDLTELLAASNGKDWIVIVRGKFDPLALEERAVKSGAQRMPHGKHLLLGREEGAVVFIDSSTALAGKPPALRTALDKRSGIPAPLLEKLKAVPTDSQLWFVSTTGLGAMKLDPKAGSGPINPQNLGRIVNSIESLTASADLRRGIALRVAGVCTTDKDAQQIHDALRGFVGMGRLSTPENQSEMLRIYDSVSIVKDDRTVRFSLQVPLDLVDKLPMIGQASASPESLRRD